MQSISRAFPHSLNDGAAQRGGTDPAVGAAASQHPPLIESHFIPEYPVLPHCWGSHILQGLNPGLDWLISSPSAAPAAVSASHRLTGASLLPVSILGVLCPALLLLCLFLELGMCHWRAKPWNTGVQRSPSSSAAHPLSPRFISFQVRPFVV